MSDSSCSNLLRERGHCQPYSSFDVGIPDPDIIPIYNTYFDLSLVLNTIFIVFCVVLLCFKGIKYMKNKERIKYQVIKQVSSDQDQSEIEHDVEQELIK